MPAHHAVRDSARLQWGPYRRHFDTSASFTGFAVSSDGGTTWIDKGALPAPFAGGATCGDPVLGSNSNGRFFFTNLHSSDSFCNNLFIGVSRSDTNGSTWTAPVNVSPCPPACGVNDKPEMAVDSSAASSFSGYVYVCWTEFVSLTTGRMWLSRSTDGGVTFPYQIALSGVANLQGCSLATGPGGDLYVGWKNADTNEIRFRHSW